MTLAINLETVFQKQKEFKMISNKKCQLCGKLGDLEQIADKFEILNSMNNEVVRIISFDEENVIIDACGSVGSIKFPKDCAVYYEPWIMDRGSYRFWVEQLGIWGKLATEFDTIFITK